MSRATILNGLAGTALVTLLTTTSADATVVNQTVRFTPSTSIDVDGYELSVGTTSGSYGTTVDLGNPAPDSQNVASAPVGLDDSVDHYLVLRARSDSGLYSPSSNEILIAAAPAPPPAPAPAPAPAPTPAPEPEPEPTPMPVPQPRPEPTPIPEPEPTPIPEPTPAPEPKPDLALPDGHRIGILRDTGAVIVALLASGETVPIAFAPAAEAYDVRPAVCDFDGDGKSEWVLGFGRRSRGQMLVVEMTDGRPSNVREVVAGESDYRTNNGATFPACGDTNGDGRDELVVGFGTGGRGFLQLFEGDGNGGLVAADTRLGNGRIKWIRNRSYNKSLGGGHPTLGDIDGDGLDEVIIGPDLQRRPYVVLLDDAETGFAPYAGLDRQGRLYFEGAPLSRRTSFFPTANDVDGDGLAEIIVGTDERGRTSMYVADDAGTGFAKPRDFGSNGEIFDLDPTGTGAPRGVRPGSGDIDGDGVAEVIVDVPGVGIGRLGVDGRGLDDWLPEDAIVAVD